MVRIGGEGGCKGGGECGDDGSGVGGAEGDNDGSGKVFKKEGKILIFGQHLPILTVFNLSVSCEN